MKIERTSTLKLDRLEAIFYGNTGAGKTTLCAMADGVFIISTERGGLLSVKALDRPYIDLVKEREAVANQTGWKITAGLFKQAVVEATKQRPKVLVLDSVTGLMRMIASDLLGGPQTQEPRIDPDVLARSDYNVLSGKLVMCLNEMAKFSGPILMTAACRSDEDKNGSITATYPDFPPAIYRQVPGQIRLMGYVEGMYDETIKKFRCRVFTQPRGPAIAKTQTGVTFDREESQEGILTKLGLRAATGGGKK